MSSTINRTSTKSLDQTCEDLHTAVSKHKFGVLTVHDLAQFLKFNLFLSAIICVICGSFLPPKKYSVA